VLLTEEMLVNKGINLQLRFKDEDLICPFIDRLQRQHVRIFLSKEGSEDSADILGVIRIDVESKSHNDVPVHEGISRRIPASS
jgi:hypothetical protein